MFPFEENHPILKNSAKSIFDPLKGNPMIPIEVFFPILKKRYRQILFH